MASKQTYLKDVKTINSLIYNYLKGIKMLNDLVEKVNVYPEDVILTHDTEEGRICVMAIWDFSTITIYENGSVKLTVKNYMNDKKLLQSTGLGREEYWDVDSSTPEEVIEYFKHKSG